MTALAPYDDMAKYRLKPGDDLACVTCRYSGTVDDQTSAWYCPPDERLYVEVEYAKGPTAWFTHESFVGPTPPMVVQRYWGDRWAWAPIGQLQELIDLVIDAKLAAMRRSVTDAIRELRNARRRCYHISPRAKDTP